MKKQFLYSMLIMFGLTLMSTTCSSDDDNNDNDNSQNIAQIEADMESGTWRISSYIDSGQNETNDFNTYNFTFESNGTLIADNGNNIMTGTWSITDSNNSNDDSNSDDDDIDFNIFFSVPDTNDFEDLNDDWDVVSHSTTRIELIDVSGGNGGIDTLTFEKN